MARRAHNNTELQIGPWLVVLSLWLGVVGSALGTVYTTFSVRTATDTLEELRRQAANLKVESGQYLLERSSLAAYSRVEEVAANKLKMEVPTFDDMVMTRRHLK